MPGSIITLPLRLSLRTARAALRTTRDVADAGLGVLEFIGDALARGDGEPGFDAPQRFAPSDRPVPAADNGHGPAPYAVPDMPLSDTPPVPGAMEPIDPVTPPEPPAPFDPIDPVEPVHIDAEAEIVEEVADEGAEDGAGAQIRVDPPFDGYDSLKAADVIARLQSADVALLGTVELYEQMHRKRRTVLDAVAREMRRPR